MRKFTVLGAAGIALLVAGCAGLLPALQAVAQGAQWLGSAIDVAEGGCGSYFDRHPSPENEPRAEQAIARARRALAGLNAALAAGAHAEQADVSGAAQEARRAYAELHALLTALGVPQARAPEGGAENDQAPAPEPFALPTPDAVAAGLGVP